MSGAIQPVDALRAADPAIRDYCQAICQAASRAHFLLKWIPPEFGQPGCFLFMLPGFIFRSGERTRNPVVSLVQACNQIRGELSARGWELPDRLEMADASGSQKPVDL